jgi:alkylation response protein AidB-like acyl-CoA dehydrogenase
MVASEQMTGAADLEEFRREAQLWIRANLEPKTEASVRTAPRTDTKTAEDIAENRQRQRQLHEGGFAGISFPKEYGGRGLTHEHERVFKEESAHYVTPDLGGAYAMTLGPIARSMMTHASEAMCRRHIPKMLSAEEIWCQFYSEPEAGSDLAGIRTTAVRDGEQWVINGSKIWTTGAYYSDWAMCLARTDWDVPKHRGLTWFAIPTSARGVTIHQIPQIDGNAGFCQEFLDDVVVPAEHVFGAVNDGWTVAQTMLVYERGGGTPMTVGLAPGERTLAPDLVDLLRRVGRDQDPVARQAVARAHINDYALAHLGRRLSRRLAGSETPNPAVAAYGKLASGTYAPIRARIAIEIGGPTALSWRPGQDGADEAALNYLNGRLVAIASGTNEMQRNGIGERVLGLPREPTFDSRKPFSEVVRAARKWDGRVG